MRLIKVTSPQGIGTSVAQLAFSVGIEQVSSYQVNSLHNDGKSEIKDTVDIETSTPKGKHFIDALLASDFYNDKDFSIAVRQPRAIVSGESLHELTQPLVEPATDMFEELWQFSHITVGFVGRIFIAACLLAYGLIHQKTLLIIAGLLFLPLLPPLLGIGFGAWIKQWRLTGQGALAFLVATALLVLGGIAVAAISSPPLRYDEFNSFGVSFLISLGVGIAAGLANVDDVGRREMIGLAATAQIAIIPVWFGICFIFGFPATTDQSEITNRALVFLVNVLTIIVASLATYILLGAASRQLARLRVGKS
jgi:hypothetical protein